MLEKKIALLTSVTFNNIGNGFIDLGAEAALMKALPLNAELFKVSSNANFAATMGQMFMLKENPIINWLWVHTMQRAAKKLHDRSYKTVKTQNIFSMASMVKCDYFIIPGCVLTVPFFTIYGDLIKRKAEQGSKIIFLGASGNFYTEYEVKFVSEYLRKLQPYAIMTRDSLAYKYYANFTKNSYNGIDNVFFVNLLNLPQIDTDLTPYVVLNIEEPKHYRIKEELKNIFKEKFDKIFAVELGLSSDTFLADTIFELETKTFLTNSDAHSLPKIAREYNKILVEDISFKELLKALKNEDGRRIVTNLSLIHI